MTVWLSLLLKISCSAFSICCPPQESIIYLYLLKKSPFLTLVSNFLTLLHALHLILSPFSCQATHLPLSLPVRL